MVDGSKFIINNRGFRGTNNNCFINCLMVAMFCYTGSPYLNIKPPQPSMPFYIYMLNLIEQMSRDMVPDCTPLRRILPPHMQMGQQDSSETYDHLMKVLKFDPITISTQNYYKTETGEIKENSLVKLKVPYINVANDGTPNFSVVNHTFKGQWEDLGENKDNWIKGNGEIGVYRYIKTSIVRMKGDCVVMLINRTNSDKRYTNSVSVPDYIDIGDEKYFRFAVVVHMGSGSIHYGHYITVIWDTKEYYIFDDTSGGKINSQKLTHEQQENIVKKHCVMVFYYHL
jgi:hypothetical protein